MALKLKWKNPNKGATTIDIYRSDTSNVDLTTPLITLSNGELEWVDTTALFGKTYYYVWAVNTGNDRVVSRPQKIEVADRKGPGPNVLQVGNETYGYFGNILAADFINTSTIYGALKSLSGIPTGVSYPSWFKFIRNGKVLFVPDSRLSDVPWNNLYAAGAVYGTNDNGPVNTPQNVNQYTTFELNGDLFLIRLPKGVPDGLVWDGTNLSLNTLPAAVDKYSEYEDLFFPICPITPLRQRMVNVANNDSANVLPTGSSSDRTAMGVSCQEVPNTTNNLFRGYGPYNFGGQSRANMEGFNVKSRAQSLCWWPVIEYVGRVSDVTLPTA